MKSFLRLACEFVVLNAIGDGLVMLVFYVTDVKMPFGLVAEAVFCVSLLAVITIKEERRMTEYTEADIELKAEQIGREFDRLRMAGRV